MFEISKYCRGLPALLDLKVRGEGPKNMAADIVGVLDLTTNYLLQGRESVFVGTVAPAVVGGNSFPTLVPANELWYVWEYFVNCAPGAGAAIDLAPSLIYDGVATINCPVGPYWSGAAAGYVEAPMTGTRWATPGTTFAFICRSVTLTPTVQAGAVVTKLRL
jgi:hypothetical protein